MQIIAKQKDLFDAHSVKDKSIYNEYMSSRDWRLHERIEKVIININGIDAVDELETIIKKSEKYGNAAFVLETSANDFRYIQAPLENLEALTNVTMVASTILVIVLLGLISILFIRNRTKEIGILMALGERKHKLFIQFTLEIILVGILSSSCAMISGNKLGSFISNEFMRIQIDTEAELEYQEDNKGAMTQLDMLEAYNVELNVEYIITIYISSIIILLISTLVPMVFVLKTNPKKVLL